MKYKKVYYMTQGAFIGYDIEKSIEKFSELVQNHYNLPFNFIAKTYVKVMYYFSLGLFNDYNKGYIDTNQFIEKLTDNLGIEAKAEEIKLAWNAMCEISEDKKQEILKIANSNLDILLVSFSNKLHREYINSQLNEIFQANGLPEYYSNKHFYIYSPENPSKFNSKDLACEAIKNFALDDKNFNTEIYSLDSRLDSDSCADLNVAIKPYTQEELLGELIHDYNLSF